MKGRATILFCAAFLGAISAACPFARADWATEIASSEPLHWWRFEETEGDVAADHGSGGLEGIYWDDVELGQPGLVGLAAGFEGFGNVLLEEENLEGDWTFEGIFSANIDEGATSQGVIGALSGSPDAMAIKAEQWDSTGVLGYTLFGVVDISFEADTPDELTHVTMVGTEEGVDLYVEGEFVDNDPTTTPLARHVIAAGHENGGVVVDPLTGLIDEIAIFDRALEEDEIARHYASIFEPADPLAPLDDGTLTDPQERADYVHDVLSTWMGDSNVDGEFNSTDLVTVFSAGKYEVDEKAGWAEGDWDGDMRFDSGDLVVAFADGGYEAGERPPVIAVPEPASIFMLLTGLIGMVIRWQQSGGRRDPTA